MALPNSFVGVVALGVVGLIAADVIIHPQGSATAFNGAASLLIPSENALLGSTNKVTQVKG